MKHQPRDAPTGLPEFAESATQTYTFFFKTCQRALCRGKKQIFNIAQLKLGTGVIAKSYGRAGNM